MSFRIRTIVFLASLFVLRCPVFAQKAPSTTQDRIWTYDPSSPDAPCPSSSGCSVWRLFRAAHPWPYQTTAVAENGTDTVIILSEPPSTLTRSQYRQLLSALFNDSLLDLTYCRWPTGLDGYLEDIVVRVRADGGHGTLRYVSGGDLAPRNGRAEIVDRLRMLYRVEYGTSDGFWLDTIEKAPDQQAIAELKVPVQDLYGWVAGNPGEWRAIEKENPPVVTTAQLYAATSPGAFVNNSGIVVLVAPKKSKLDDLRAPFRRFAVASDLIIGAIGNQNGSMLLFARARTVPLSQLPPLRFETFASFARNRAADIAQSYERQRIFAGKIQTGKYADWDWAPILLSPQLDDTEFGTLLNLADQILKSWSQHGDVEYYAFPYPKPDKYPFGDMAASEYFREKFHTTSLLFNWNTTDFSEIARVGSQNILTASRTGALRILYRPSDGLEELDDAKDSASDTQKDAQQRARDAQDYFAGRGNSILVRVVQNVLLYQAEQNFLTIADPQSPPTQGRADRVAAVLEDQAAKWLSAAAQRKPSGTEDAITLKVLNEILQKSQLTPEQFARLIASPQKIMIELERSRQLALRSQREALAMAQQSERTAQTGMATFKDACQTVGGSLTENPKGGLVCDWRHKVGDPRPRAFSEADALEVQYKGEVAAAEGALKKRDQYVADAQSLQEKYLRASELGKIVTQLSGAADLDLVLSQVVKAGAATPDSGSIRTPSVVLSKNVLDAEAIGGHNIDLVPSPIVTEIKPVNGTSPGGGVVRGQTAVTGPAVRKQVITEPAAPVEQVLGKPRSGTLLEEMRARTNAEPSSFAEVSARAKICNCDAIVSQTNDGTILFVRNAPPPLQRVILGKSGVIDAMAAPPSLKVVHFENFDRGAVESIARTQVLVNSKTETGGLDRTISNLKGIFSGDRGEGGSGAEILIARENAEPESLTLIGDYDRRVSLKESVSWHTAEVREPSATEWDTTFGAGPDSNQSGYSRMIVRFGQATGNRDALGVSVGAAESAGFASRLKLVLNQWLGRQSLHPAPISDALLDLRTAIVTRLKPNHLQFYLKRNGGVIRAAHADFPMQLGDPLFSE